MPSETRMFVCGVVVYLSVAVLFWTFFAISSQYKSIERAAESNAGSNKPYLRYHARLLLGASFEQTVCSVSKDTAWPDPSLCKNYSEFDLTQVVRGWQVFSRCWNSNSAGNAGARDSVCTMPDFPGDTVCADFHPNGVASANGNASAGVDSVSVADESSARPPIDYANASTTVWLVPYDNVASDSNVVACECMCLNSRPRNDSSVLCNAVCPRTSIDRPHSRWYMEAHILWALFQPQVFISAVALLIFVFALALVSSLR
jgi:hypothetical protein